MSTILLVDDEPELLDLYTEVLELMDHRVLRAHDGKEALEIAHERRPDLVVTDWQMPRMSGLELCTRLARDEELHDVPIIMHSSAADPHAPGVKAFLSKCSELHEFEEAVSQVLTESGATPQGPPRVGPALQELSRQSQSSWEYESACIH
ncbi:MAG TPA: response regulator [Archangium sp.]|jgi:CheY-like chemotaxis protein|uniref:response regulator n=1 Tax=Archangium sp. TaxID=1872627 RepID=UPI002ED90E1F